VFNKSAVILKLCAQTNYMVLKVFFNLFEVKEFIYWNCSCSGSYIWCYSI